ncbi:hypothetical protein BX070DRAFT_244985 [Coemansia spiralis]|nr:hypothetical protein BX070DRAFT_244985 [Coemansia spiralis]
MPRRRHRRLEWTNSMQSHTTLVELTMLPDPANVATSTDVNSTTPQQPPSDANGNAADARPVQIRSVAGSFSQNTRAIASSHQNENSNGSGPLVRQSAMVTRSDSEQTNAGLDSPSSAKVYYGFGRRFKETLRRRFRIFSETVVPAHARSPSHGMDGYYAVAMH